MLPVRKAETHSLSGCAFLVINKFFRELHQTVPHPDSVLEECMRIFDRGGSGASVFVDALGGTSQRVQELEQLFPDFRIRLHQEFRLGNISDSFFQHLASGRTETVRSGVTSRCCMFCRRIDIPAVARLERGVGIAAQRIIGPVVPCPAEESVCALGEGIPHHPLIFCRIIVEKASRINTGAVVDGRIQSKLPSVRGEPAEQIPLSFNVAQSHGDIVDLVRKCRIVLTPLFQCGTEPRRHRRSCP